MIYNLVQSTSFQVRTQIQDHMESSVMLLDHSFEWLAFRFSCEIKFMFISFQTSTPSQPYRVAF